MKFLTLLSITCLLVGSVSAHAAQDAGELLFDDPEIVQTQEPITHEAWTQLHRQQSPKKKNEVSGYSLFDMFSSQGLNGLPALGDIVNLGKLIWEVIQYNRPAANLSSDFANAVPRGTESWKDLSGWSSPQAQTFTVTYKNKFRAKVVDFKYQLLYTHSGSMKGQGKYLANITVIPAKINVLAGFKLNASATVPQVTNMGTEELPVAAAQVLVKWRVETLLQHQQVAKVYSLTGAGEYKDITHP